MAAAGGDALIKSVTFDHFLSQGTNQRCIMKAGEIGILFLLGVVFAFIGCQQDIIGTEIPADKRITLVKGGPQTGTWKTFDYEMNYTYRYSQPRESAPGSIEFSASLETMSGGLDSLAISIYLLDGNGRVLKIDSLYDSGYKESRSFHNRSFSVTLATPPETAGISFAHTSQRSRGHK